MTLPSGSELFIVLFIVLLLFGGKRLPGLARSLGTSMREFRGSVTDLAGDGGETGHLRVAHVDEPTVRDDGTSA